MRDEEMYWTHFKFKSIVVHLSEGNFQEQLSISNKFAVKMRKTLPDSVSLRGPSEDLWNVELSFKENTLFFTKGWTTFAKDHSLEANDVLVFTYNGESTIDVKIFSQSGHEKEALYFIRNDKEIQAAGESSKSQFQTKRKIHAVIGIDDSSEDGGGGEDSPAPPHEASSDVSLSRDQEFNSYARSKKILRKATEGENSVPDDETGTEPKPSRPRHRQPRGGGSVSLEVIMHVTHVQRRFQLGLQSYWVEKYIPLNTRELILRVEGKESLVQVYRYRNRQYIETGLYSSGWKDFVHKNGLKLKDKCVFTPAGKTDQKGHVILDVAIHRWQEEEMMEQTPTAIQNINALTPD